MKAFKEYLEEKLIVVGKGAKYGQVVFMAAGGGCFLGETLVKTTNGHKPISSVLEGDIVYTLNENTKEIETQRVVQRYENDIESPIIELKFDDGTIIVCTENHKFYINGEWIEAKNLLDI